MPQKWAKNHNKRREPTPHSQKNLMMMASSTNDNKKKSGDDSESAAPARPYVMQSKEDIERHIANMLWIAYTEVRAQMQKEVAAESGIDESYAVHAYHYLFFNPSSNGMPPPEGPELSIEAFRAAAKAALMARVKAEAGAPDTDEEDEEGEGQKKKNRSRKQKKRRATGASSSAAGEEEMKKRQRVRDGA